MVDADPASLVLFRSKVRDFIRARLPGDVAQRGLTGFHSSQHDQRIWGRILNEHGWSAPTWPAEYGGAGWTSAQVQIFDEECYLAGAPELSWNGVRLVGPVIYTFGDEEQKAKFLPPTLGWEIFWGQGFTEPDSGSDLASLRTLAVAVGDDYVVNGSKIWMTDGHFADYLFCLVRTSSAGRKQEGISFLLVDARSPGVEIRPISSIDGQHTLNQVFFGDVRVPLANRIGPEGAGWSYAKFLLANERTSSAEVPRCKFYLQRLRHLSATVRKNGRSLAEDPIFSMSLARLEIDLMALEASVLQALAVRETGQNSFAQASVLKLKGSHLLQAMGALMVEAIGPDAIIRCDPPCAPGDLHPTIAGTPSVVGEHVPGIVADFLYRRAATIYGGSAEIQRSIIASHLLPQGG
jgi:alkylation response protein AidB-like acyl-CoA dehydrogenase